MERVSIQIHEAVWRNCMVQLYWNHIVSVVPCITPNIVQPWPWNLGLTEIRGTFIHSVNLDRWGKKQLCHIDSSKIPSHYISVKNCVPLFCFPPLKFQNLVPPFFVVFHWFILFISPHPKFYKVKKSLILKNLLQLLHFCNYSKQTSVFFLLWTSLSVYIKLFSNLKWKHKSWVKPSEQ